MLLKRFKQKYGLCVFGLNDKNAILQMAICLSNSLNLYHVSKWNGKVACELAHMLVVRIEWKCCKCFRFVMIVEHSLRSVAVETKA